ncbi:MAG: ABC transporter ATP-binding protein [Bacteroidales bacterium]|nr:MAG: ABC transporter ATP-binding protein [Bacteroidales bacterium]
MVNFFKILKYIKPYWFYATLNVVFNIISAGAALFSFTMVVPFLRILFGTQQMITDTIPFEFSIEYFGHTFNYYISQLIVNQGKSMALLLVSLLVVIMTLFKTFFKFMALYYTAPIRTGTVRDIRKEIFEKILKLPLSYYTDARKGDVISRITSDVQEIETSIMSSLEMLIRDPLTILIFTIYMFIISVKLTLFGLVLLPISGYLIGRLGKKLRSTSFRGQKKLGFLLSVIEETLGGLRIIKAFNAERKVERRFDSNNNFYTRIMNKVHRRRYLANPSSEFLSTAVMMVLMFYGGSLVLSGSGDLSSETFIAYLVIFSQIIPPAKSLTTAFFNIQKGLASLDRIGGILEADVTIKDKPNARHIEGFNEYIEYRNVSFKYNEELVLKNVNLKIEKGKTIALVGKSGAGKSTLVDLLPRFIEATEGEVVIDGGSVNDLKLFDLRKLMGIVSQQSILFNDTFFNNIAFGMDNATEEDVIAASKVANAHDFIIEHNHGYYSNVGEGGSKLSGGQQQRVSIARAVLKNPPILILDEATSSLDTESERLVQEAIINLMKNRTSIVIAHRLSTIKHADEIIVLDEGEIVERGKHPDLLKKNGYYWKLHDMQMR